VQSHHHQGVHYLCLLKLQLLKWPNKIHRRVVMWLHILVGPCWCVYVVLLGIRLLPNSAAYTPQQGPTNICSHIITELITQRCILIAVLTTVTSESTNNAIPDDGVTAPETCQSRFNVNYIVFNHLTPNGHFSGRTAPLTYRCCIFLFIQQIYVLNILNMMHTLCFFLFKMSFIS
jgi:hypothetical protein